MAKQAHDNRSLFWHITTVRYGTGEAYSVDTEGLTLLYRDEQGELWDLNALGEPCRTAADLCALIEELHQAGTFNAATRDDMMADVAA